MLDVKWLCQTESVFSSLLEHPDDSRSAEDRKTSLSRDRTEQVPQHQDRCLCDSASPVYISTFKPFPASPSNWLLCSDWLLRFNKTNRRSCLSWSTNTQCSLCGIKIHQQKQTWTQTCGEARLGALTECLLSNNKVTWQHHVVITRTEWWAVWNRSDGLTGWQKVMSTHWQHFPPARFPLNPGMTLRFSSSVS